MRRLLLSLALVPQFSQAENLWIWGLPAESILLKGEVLSMTNSDEYLPKFAYVVRHDNKIFYCTVSTSLSCLRSALTKPMD
jgi:hypothetical protein